LFKTRDSDGYMVCKGSEIETYSLDEHTKQKVIAVPKIANKEIFIQDLTAQNLMSHMLIKGSKQNEFMVVDPILGNAIWKSDIEGDSVLAIDISDSLVVFAQKNCIKIFDSKKETTIEHYKFSDDEMPTEILCCNQGGAFVVKTKGKLYVFGANIFIYGRLKEYLVQKTFSDVCILLPNTKL